MANNNLDPQNFFQQWAASSTATVTAFEISYAYGCSHQAASRLLTTLVKDGKATKRPVKHLTSSGIRRCHAYTIVKET